MDSPTANHNWNVVSAAVVGLVFLTQLALQGPSLMGTFAWTLLGTIFCGLAIAILGAFSFVRDPALFISSPAAVSVLFLGLSMVVAFTVETVCHTVLGQQGDLMTIAAVKERSLYNMWRLLQKRKFCGTYKSVFITIILTTLNRLSPIFWLFVQQSISKSGTSYRVPIAMIWIVLLYAALTWAFCKYKARHLLPHYTMPSWELMVSTAPSDHGFSRSTKHGRLRDAVLTRLNGSNDEMLLCVRAGRPEVKKLSSPDSAVLEFCFPDSERACETFCCMGPTSQLYR